MPAIDGRRWTYEEVRRLIEEQDNRSVRYELADGELLVTPAPGGYHQRLVLALFRLIDPFVNAHELGEVRLGPSEINIVPRTIFQPDLYVVPAVGGNRPRADIPVTHALLVVEVLSRGSLRHDRVTKRRHYQRAGVAEYWIVDPESELVERWTPSDERPEVLDQQLTWGAGDRLLVIDLPSMFRAVRDD